MTGGAGAIGSHTCVELLKAGYELVVFDNFCNSHAESLERIKKITGKELYFYQGDVRQRDDLRRVFHIHR